MVEREKIGRSLSLLFVVETMRECPSRKWRDRRRQWIWGVGTGHGLLFASSDVVEIQRRRPVFARDEPKSESKDDLASFRPKEWMNERCERSDTDEWIGSWRAVKVHFAIERNNVSVGPSKANTYKVAGKEQTNDRTRPLAARQCRGKKIQNRIVRKNAKSWYSFASAEMRSNKWRVRNQTCTRN